MKTSPILATMLLLTGAMACKSDPKNTTTDTEPETETAMTAPPAKEVKITPIAHATAVLEWNGHTLYIDPVGGADAFKGQASPDMILVTDIHGDHFNPETLEAVKTPGTIIIAPKAVADQMPDGLKAQTTIMDNGDKVEKLDVEIEAIPMYNLREEALKFHEKGRGNGYVLTLGNQRIYFSGDTEDIPEMRALKNIDKAFVCMNLPYTMTVESAADGVLAFAPKQVYPYHYRGNPDVSDVAKFKALVEAGNPDIEVVQWDWYPNDPY